MEGWRNKVSVLPVCSDQDTDIVGPQILELQNQAGYISDKRLETSPNTVKPK